MLIQAFHKTPIELWVVSYDILGWTVTPYHGCGISQFISEKAALRIVEMIKCATEICAIDNGLKNIDIAYEVALNEQFFLSVEQDDNDDNDETNTNN